MMDLSRKRKYNSIRKKKIRNWVLYGSAISAILGTAHMTGRTYALFSSSAVIKGSFKAAFVFPETLKCIIDNLPTINIGKDSDEVLDRKEREAKAYDAQFEYWYQKALAEKDSGTNDDSNYFLEYFTHYYQLYKSKQSSILDQISEARKENERMREEEKKKKEKEEKEKKEKEEKEKQDKEKQDKDKSKDNILLPVGTETGNSNKEIKNNASSENNNNENINSSESTEK